MSFISERDFRGIDLNMLVHFLVLVRERSVSRAAQRLFVGQPAMSATLARLRQLFGDELLVRTAQGMVPTARAQELAHALAPVLASVQAALVQAPAFEASRSQRTFTLGMPDWIEMWVMPALLPQLAKAAPGVRLAVKSSDRRRGTHMLEHDEMDLGISVFAKGPPWQRHVELAAMDYQCVYDPRQVPLTGRLTLPKYLAHPHLFISYQGDFEGAVDEALKALDRKRRVVHSTPHFGTLPFVLRSMPAYATVPALLARHWVDQFAFGAAAVPVALPAFAVSMVWHAKRDGDLGLQWLRTVVGQAVRSRR